MTKEAEAQILLVEDDSFLAGIYKTKFELEGFKVTVVGDGEAALDEVKKKRPDVILLDILLPKLDGFGVLMQLKQDKNLPRIPVIIITNLGQKEDIEKGLALGAADYLIKTHFQPAEVVKRVKKFIVNSLKGGERNE